MPIADDFRLEERQTGNCQLSELPHEMKLRLTALELAVQAFGKGQISSTHIIFEARAFHSYLVHG